LPWKQIENKCNIYHLLEKVMIFILYSIIEFVCACFYIESDISYTGEINIQVSMFTVY